MRTAAKALVALVGVSVLAAPPIAWGYLEQAKYERAAQDRRVEYARNTYGPKYQACRRATNINQSDCIAEARKEAADYHHNERDLVAQQTTAAWTFLMGCAAIIGVALSAVGVFLVWTTFRETQKANLIASRAYETDIRPILVPEGAEFDVAGDHFSVKVTLVWKNVGKLPAKLISVEPSAEKFTETTVASERLYKSLPITFTLDELKSEIQFACARIAYKTAVGESDTEWSSERRAQIVPSLTWPHSNGQSVLSGNPKVPCPTAFKVTGARLSERNDEVKLT